MVKDEKRFHLERINSKIDSRIWSKKRRVFLFFIFNIKWRRGLNFYEVKTPYLDMLVVVLVISSKFLNNFKIIIIKYESNLGGKN